MNGLPLSLRLDDWEFLVMDEAFYNRVAEDRLSARQIDELIGLARGLCADGELNQREVEFLQSWLAANATTTRNPLILTLYQRIDEALADGFLDADEQRDLFDALSSFTGERIELGETLKPSSLPLCMPQPDIIISERSFVFTGTFMYGQRKHCEEAVRLRGGACSSLTKSTDYLVVGDYASESWKHSSMGNKILKACEMRSKGVPISIVSEAHWTKYL